MGYQIARQPNGQYCLFSTYSDTVIGLDHDREEVVEWYVQLEADRARRDIGRWLDDVDKGWMTHTYDEMLKRHTPENAPDDPAWNAEIVRRLDELGRKLELPGGA